MRDPAKAAGRIQIQITLENAALVRIFAWFRGRYVGCTSFGDA
jgi:hypothetical protein